MSKGLKYLFWAVLLIGLQVESIAQSFDKTIISQEQFQLPVLKLKKDNPVIRIAIVVPVSENHKVTRFVFSTKGSSSVSDIAKAKLYYQNDSMPGTEGRFENTKLLGVLKKVKQEFSFKVNQTLSPGKNYFWLSYELNDNADLLHFVDANCTSVTIDQKKIMPAAEEKNIIQRIGLALRQHWQDNVHTYRIPGLTTTKKGTLLAVYDVRKASSRDLQGDIDIGLSRSEDGGNTWEPMRIAMDMKTWGGLPEKFNGVSDANILADEKTGNVFIAALWMHGVLDSSGKWITGLSESSTDWNHQWRNKGSQSGFDIKQTAQFLIVKSMDDGKTWSEPINLTAICKQEEWWLWAPAPGHGITLTDGVLVFPTQGRDKTGRPFSNITYSKDSGMNWIATSAADTGSTTESMAVQLTNEELMLNMRANENGKEKGMHNGRAIMITNDLGKTWTSHSTSRNALQEPVCMASIHKHFYNENGTRKSVLLFSNPDSKTNRNRLTIKLSFDDGKNWPKENQLLLDEWEGSGYSCITSIDENTIGILYESSMANLVFQKIAIKDLIKN